jgi:hypothetical protein
MSDGIWHMLLPLEESPKHLSWSGKTVEAEKPLKRLDIAGQCREWWWFWVQSSIASAAMLYERCSLAVPFVLPISKR